MRRIYTVIFYMLVPFIELRLYWKSRGHPAYRQRIAERFACSTQAITSVDIWLHAVSLGEVVAATPLIEGLLVDNQRVLVTTMTPSGSEQVRSKWGNRVAHQYVPYDLPWCLRRFFKRWQPRVGIIMETELWPNLIYYAKSAQVKLVLVNARLSDHAFPYYEKTKLFFKPVLKQFAFIGAQSALDAERYLALGAPKSVVHVIGNIKFDMIHPGSMGEQFSHFKEKWGKERPVFIAASTHDDEENQLLTRLGLLQAAIPNIVMLIAPRRPERFQTVYALSQSHGFQTALRSQPESIGLDSDVIILDSLGELLGFFQLSDYAFVGGSLVPVGGHNVLEPIAMGVPVFCGPFMQNSKSICTDLKTAGAIQWTENADACIEAMITMCHQPEKRAQQIQNATQVLKANQGTVGAYLEEITKLNNCSI